ncbi:kinase-like domain-containing protein, partial [Paraphoma chrysanthemicola]
MESDYRYPAPSAANPQSSPPWFEWLDIRAGNHYDDVDETTLPYVHRRHLGKGGYGLVEAVEDRMTGRVYARKVFHPRKRERARMWEMFENEVQNTRALKAHHHMVRLHATYTTKDTLAMIMMPVADGGDLEKFLDEFNQYRNEHASQISGHEASQMLWKMGVLQMAFGCLAAGLMFMHDQKIRHKDIKPSNILIHGGKVLYTDFGIARDTALFQDSATTGPAVKATRKYAAPEVLADAARRSSSDVYSLGCVFVEIFASLDGTFEISDIQRFSDHMASIHQAL